MLFLRNSSDQLALIGTFIIIENSIQMYNYVYENQTILFDVIASNYQTHGILCGENAMKR